MSVFTPTFGELSILHIPLDDSQNNLVKDLVKDHIPNRFWCTNLAYFFGDGDSTKYTSKKKKEMMKMVFKLSTRTVLQKIHL